MMVPDGDPKYTGLPTTRPSASASFSAVSLTRSSKTHFPSIPHCPQAMQPRMSLFPIWISSVSIPSSSNVRIISSSAAAVQPLAWGLPLISNTFAICSLLFFPALEPVQCPHAICITKAPRIQLVSFQFSFVFINNTSQSSFSPAGHPAAGFWSPW